MAPQNRLKPSQGLKRDGAAGGLLGGEMLPQTG